MRGIYEEAERGERDKKKRKRGNVYDPAEIISANVAIEFTLIIRDVAAFWISGWMRRNIAVGAACIMQRHGAKMLVRKR